MKLLKREVWSESHPRLRAFLHRFRDSNFTEQETGLIESTLPLVHCEPVGALVRHQRDLEARPWIVASGWACYARTLGTRGRQIFRFILPGDTIGLAAGPFAHGDVEVVALTELALIDASRVKEAAWNRSDEHPNIRNVCKFEQERHEQSLLASVVRLGRLTSLQRTADLLLELHHRSAQAGLIVDGSFQIPITQFQLGEALGLSLVHVNRTLQTLRHQGLLTLAAGVAVIDPGGLEQLLQTLDADP